MKKANVRFNEARNQYELFALYTGETLQRYTKHIETMSELSYTPYCEYKLPFKQIEEYANKRGYTLY